MARYFAPDVPAERAALPAASQPPLFAGAYNSQVTAAAFTEKSTWFVVAGEHQIIPPSLRSFFAERMGATAVHVAMLSQPEAVAEAILAPPAPATRIEARGRRGAISVDGRPPSNRRVSAHVLRPEASR